MPTTIHLPSELLEHVDRRAEERDMSRNRYIVQALERAVEEETSWSRTFLETLATAAEDRDSHKAVDQMMADIESHRTRKAPRRL